MPGGTDGIAAALTGLNGKHKLARVQAAFLVFYYVSVCFHCSICVLDFPHCVVHEMPELTAESLVSENPVSMTHLDEGQLVSQPFRWHYDLCCVLYVVFFL